MGKTSSGRSRDSRDARYPGPGGRVAEALQDAEGRGPGPIEVASGAGDEEIHVIFSLVGRFLARPAAVVPGVLF